MNPSNDAKDSQKCVIAPAFQAGHHRRTALAMSRQEVLDQVVLSPRSQSINRRLVRLGYLECSRDDQGGIRVVGRYIVLVEQVHALFAMAVGSPPSAVVPSIYPSLARRRSGQGHSPLLDQRPDLVLKQNRLPGARRNDARANLCTLGWQFPSPPCRNGGFIDHDLRFYPSFLAAAVEPRIPELRRRLTRWLLSWKTGTRPPYTTAQADKQTQNSTYSPTQGTLCVQTSLLSHPQRSKRQDCHYTTNQAGTNKRSERWEHIPVNVAIARSILSGAATNHGHRSLPRIDRVISNRRRLVALYDPCKIGPVQHRTDTHRKGHRSLACSFHASLRA